MMYIRCFLLLKLSALAIALPARNDNNLHEQIVSPYPSRASSTLHPAAMSKRTQAGRSSDNSRVEFQVRNHQGPGTYIFGFDTGHGKNRQYRVEERLRDGRVKGRYGFYDAKGKLRVVNYVAEPSNGYQERHHETIISRPGN